MSRLCAKPTCSDVAERWFDVNATDRQVVERSEPTPSTIALCASHASRLSAPSGWEWIGLDTATDAHVEPVDLLAETDLGSGVDSGVAGPAAQVHEPVEESQQVPQRRHTRDAPWFLANSPSTGHQDLPSAPSKDVSGSAEAAPTVGSLLHRAFHGPDRDEDTARAREVDSAQSGGRGSSDQRAAIADVEIDVDVEDGSGDDGDVATVRDLASRRSARTASTSYDVELPFPPVDAEPHIAVS